MILSQDDRIVISKKLVSIPRENAASLDNKTKLQEEMVKVQKQDNVNKNIFNDQNLLINSYQNELARQDGVVRSQTVEQDVVDTAQQKLGNFFSLNDISTPTPSVPTGVWINFTPFAGNKAIGKDYSENYPGSLSPIENDMISAVNSAVSVIEGFTPIGRSTGQYCNGSGTCSLPIYLTQPDCTTNGGIWTPGVDLISNDPDIQAAAAVLISSVNDFKAFLQATLVLIVTSDSNATRQSQNNAAIADINNAISVIDSWLALPTFDTNHGQVTCVGFYSYNVNLLNPTKFRAGELSILKNEVSARTAFIPTRISQLNSALGSISQNSDGSISSSSGTYGVRFSAINLRLNLMNGSLRRLEGMKLGIKAQDESIALNNDAQDTYSSLMTASAFRAPALGGPAIHVKDGSGFSIGDSVYVISDSQLEISATILDKTGDMLVLSKDIPAKYRQNENARVYKVL